MDGFMAAAGRLTLIAAWATHVLWVIVALASLEVATAGVVALMLAGIFVPPVGGVHGVMIWFGFDVGAM